MRLVQLAALVCGALLAPCLSYGAQVTIALLGDQQSSTDCTRGPEAWLHASDMATWVADSSGADLVIQLGDITEYGGNQRAVDCECMALAPAPTCGDLVTTGSPSGCADCNDSDAVTCAGGTPGPDCEWLRARSLVDTIEAAGIPWIVIPGNHDYDANSWESGLAFFNRFFGSELQTAHATTVATAVSGPSSAPTGFSTFHVVHMGGIDWLHIGVSHRVTQAELDWAESIILAHPGMPTIISTHVMMSHLAQLRGGSPFIWGCSNIGWCADGDGEKIFDQLSRYPQVFLNLGGHAIGVSHTQVNHPEGGHSVIGAMIDYSLSVEGGASWATTSNGGGGVAVMMTFDLDAGRVDVRSYSARQDEWIPESQGGEWSYPVAFCSARFDTGDGCLASVPVLPLGAALALAVALALAAHLYLAIRDRSPS